MYCIIIIGSFLLSIGAVAQTNSPHQLLRQADKAYRQQQYEEAAELYQRANTAAPAPRIAYNLGNTYYQKNNYEEAVKQYEKATAPSGDPILRARAYHNLGNAHYNQQAYEKSIAAYKAALRLQPTDLDTKKNLAMAQRQLQAQQQSQPQQQQQQDNSSSADNKDDASGKDPTPPKDPPSQSSPPQNDPSQPQSPQHTPSTSPNRQEAERLLQIMNDEERKVQQKMRHSDSKPSKSAKDW